MDQRHFYGPANIAYNYYRVGLIFLRPPHLGIEIAPIRDKKGGSKLDPILICWRWQNEKAILGSNVFGIGHFSPYSNNGAGIGTNWYPTASPNRHFGAPRGDTPAWYRCLRCP